MAKDRGQVAATAPAVEPDRDAEATPAPEAAPAAAPAETPAEETTPEEPAAAAATTLEIPTLISQSSEVRKVMSQLEEMEALSVGLRSSIHHMIGAENRKGMKMGQQLFFAALAHGTFDIQRHVTEAQKVLTGQALLDNEGDIAAEDKD